MDYTQIKSVGIVGAGVAGLATARSLLAQGIECTIFERNPTLGGVWSDGYLNFGVQVQKELYEFPDWPLPDDTPDFTAGPIIHQYLQNYSDHFKITPIIRFNTEVTEITELTERSTGSERYQICFDENHSQQTRSFDLVVICIGLYSNRPNLINLPNREQYSGHVIHNSELKSSDQLIGKKVAIIGFGKSATDAALESVSSASETHLIFRTPHWPIPSKLAGILPFKWGLLHRLNSTLIPKYQTPSPVEKIIHSIGKPLVWFYWRLVEALLYFQCQLGSKFRSRLSLVPDTPIEIDAFGESTMLPRSDFYKRARRGEIKLHHTTPKQYTDQGLMLSNAQHLDVDLIIMATGWKTNFDFISNNIWERLQPEDDGFYLYRHILNPNTPGLLFIGRAATVSSILTYSLQAHWLGQLIKGNITLPSNETMDQNINQMKIWKRSWMPFSAARSARLIAHTQHYHDELLKDFGKNPLRKTGLFAPLKEFIFPYEPRDYAALFKSN